MADIIPIDRLYIKKKPYGVCGCGCNLFMLPLDMDSNDILVIGLECANCGCVVELEQE